MAGKRKRDYDQQMVDVPKDKVISNTESHRFIQFLKKKIVEKKALLECPVCLETASVPIYACKKMHLICSSCYPKLETCPECRTEFSNPASSRNRLREETLEELRKLEQELQHEQERHKLEAEAKKKVTFAKTFTLSSNVAPACLNASLGVATPTPKQKVVKLESLGQNIVKLTDGKYSVQGPGTDDITLMILNQLIL